MAQPVTRLSARRKRLGMLSLLGRPGMMLRFLRDSSAPTLPRVLLVLAVFYAVFPIDALPDVIPFIGWIDDLGIMGTVVAYIAAAAARHENARLESGVGVEPAAGPPAT